MSPDLKDMKFKDPKGRGSSNKLPCNFDLLKAKKAILD